MTLASLYTYDNGQSEIAFCRGGTRDWYVWSVTRQRRLASYRTRRELMAAYERSHNRDGPYGCARLDLHAETAA